MKSKQEDARGKYTLLKGSSEIPTAPHIKKTAWQSLSEVDNNGQWKGDNHSDGGKNDFPFIYSASGVTNSCPHTVFLRVRMGDKVLHNDGTTERGSSIHCCHTKVIQTVNRADVAIGKREIPHCITNLLSKLYYLGHGLLYGCQSYRTKHWSNSPYLASPAPTQKLIHRKG